MSNNYLAKQITPLTLRVNAVNALHATINLNLPRLIEVMKRHVEKKVILAEGGFCHQLRRDVKDFRLELPEGAAAAAATPSGIGFQLVAFTLSLQVKFTICFEQDRNTVDYYNLTVMLGELDGAVLKDTAEPVKFVTDYTEMKVISARDEIRFLENEKNKILFRFSAFRGAMGY